MAKKTLKKIGASKAATPEKKAIASKTKPAAAKTKAAKQARIAAAKASKNLATELPTAAELQLLGGLPVRTKKDVARFHRAPAGYEEVAQKTLKAWQTIDAKFWVPGLSVDDLAQALAERDAVAPIERKLAALAERAYRHRVCADGRAVKVLLALGRAVKGMGNQALAVRFRELIAWIKATHSGPTKRAKKPDGAPPTEP